MKKTTEYLESLHSKTRMIEKVIAREVAELRANNVPWSQIGSALGVTKQRAQQKYGTRNTANDHMYTPEENAEADKALAAMQAIAAAQDKATEDHAQHVEAAAIFLDGTAPAKAKKATKKPEAFKPQPDDRPSFWVENAASINGVAQPGTGKGPHLCTRCGSTNHKGSVDEVRMWPECTPTKYDTKETAAYMNGLTK
jgi:hypothetical protein